MTIAGSSSEGTPLASKPLRLLFVEHEPNDVEIALQELKKASLDFDVEIAATREEFARKLRERVFDIVLSD
jgi:predicted O-methyltransferase YrrM